MIKVRNRYAEKSILPNPPVTATIMQISALEEEL